MDKTQILKEKIADAELVLIGIGEEFNEDFHKIGQHPHLMKGLEEIDLNENLAWTVPFVEKAYLEEEKEAEEQAVEDTALFQMRQRIADLLSGLEETDQKLLSLRFGLEGGKPLSPEDTGNRLGLTPEEVVEREAAALAKLRNQ